MTPEKPAASGTIERDKAALPSTHNTFDVSTIDFHSPEFNRTDDLNDNSGNYQFFEPLDGIITADMRHQMERLCELDCADSPVDGVSASKEKKIAIEGDEPEPVECLSPLTVISEGRTLIVDTDAARAFACGNILSDQRLTCTLVMTKKASQDASISRFNRPALVEADDVSITGAFGGFSATVTVKGDHRHLTEGFDLVLDLQPTPSFAGRRLPMGYYAPGPDSEELNKVMAELPEMRGQFQKPQFTTFQKNRCLHGLARTRDCRKCIEVCPFGAIQSVDRKVSVNHYLCQGCGGCALVCPADAIRMVHPPQEEILNALRSSLESRTADADAPLMMVISDPETADYTKLPATDEKANDRMVRFEVEEIGYIGLETILAALSYGVRRVVVACGNENPPGIRNAVAWHTELAGAILKGLDMPEDKCRFVVVPPEESPFEEEASKTDSLDAQTNVTPISPQVFPPRQERRVLIRLTAQHLYETSGSRKPWLPLPSGSPFGTVTVDPSTCTLCMACAAACPSGALSAGGDVPRLLFLEARCHQCSLCEETCPEHAIQLLPRLLCDPKAVEARVVLREAEAFRCIKCDMPFASRAMVNSMKEKLKGHWMYASERQLSRLQMCRICRTRDALVSENMKSWNL